MGRPESAARRDDWTQRHYETSFVRGLVWVYTLLDFRHPLAVGEPSRSRVVSSEGKGDRCNDGRASPFTSHGGLPCQTTKSRESDARGRPAIYHRSQRAPVAVANRKRENSKCVRTRAEATSRTGIALKCEDIGCARARHGLKSVVASFSKCRLADALLSCRASAATGSWGRRVETPP